MTPGEKCERCGGPVAASKAYCDACMAELRARDSRCNAVLGFADARHELDEGCPYCGRVVCRCDNRDCASLLPKMETQKHSEPGA